MKNTCYLVVLIISFISCTNTIKGDSNTSSNKIDIKRLDKDLYTYLNNPTAEGVTSLQNKYPTLLPALGYVTMGVESDSTNLISKLNTYYKHPLLWKIYEDAVKQYQNIDKYEKTLTEASNRLTEYLPKTNLPQFAMHVSGFKENIIFTEDNIISISIDKYLGKNYNDYQGFFKDYQLQQMQPQMIVRDYLKAYLYTINEEEEIVADDGRKSSPNLLSRMIHEGKQLYILSVLLPDYTDSDLIGYTSQQIDWCKENENAMWQLFTKQNRLFSSDYQPIVNYIEDAPYTAGFSTDSPGRVGQWMGWQIVKAYMKKTDASVEQLLASSSQDILKGSRYNP